jgi:chromosome segregation ATPase
MQVENVIAERLITHESVVGANEPSIQNTTKRFFQFSETIQGDESKDKKTDVAYHQLLTEISRYEFDLQSGAVVQNTCARELKQYSKIESEIESAISQTQGDIEKLKSTLKQERLRRQQKEEYETISRIINTHRPRDALQKDIAALETRLDSLNTDAEDASSKVEVRQKQLHLFLSSMQELSSLWAEDQGDVSINGSGKASPRLPNPSNDEMDEDDDDEEDDDRRYHRGAEEVDEMEDEDQMMEDVDVDGDDEVAVDGEDGEIVE